MSRGVFIVGTDTGVGKTTAAVGLVAELAARGLRVAAMKPCETGDGDDATRLLQATGRPLDPALVNPYRFPLPAAPAVAARRAGARVELARIEACYRALAADAELTVVEGAGGLLVPYAEGVTTVDVIARLGLPVLLVARTGLGTINHTLLTAEVARRRGLAVLGVLFSRCQRRIGPEEGETVSTIVRLGELRAFGVLPWLARPVLADPTRLAAQVRAHVRVDALLRLITRDIQNY